MGITLTNRNETHDKTSGRINSGNVRYYYKFRSSSSCPLSES